MRVFQFNHQEILITDRLDVNEESFVSQYKELLDELLLINDISNKRVFECINLKNYKVTSTPFIIESLLRKKEIPPFRFLAAKN